MDSQKKNEKGFRRMERKAARKALDKVLASGENGVQIETLKKDLKSAGEIREAIEKGIRRLHDENQIKETDGKLFSRGAFLLKTGAYSQKDVYKFVVEKVLSGKAIIRVDNDRRAILSVEDYEGPRHLIKKGRNFTGIAELYRENGNHMVWIKEVVKIEE